MTSEKTLCRHCGFALGLHAAGGKEIPENKCPANAHLPTFAKRETATSGAEYDRKAAKFWSVRSTVFAPRG